MIYHPQPAWAEKLYEAVEAAVDAGVTPVEFIKEARECWGVARSRQHGMDRYYWERVDKDNAR